MRAKNKKHKPFWERGYNGHVYWFGKRKLGKVTRHRTQDAKHRYTWEAAGRAGASDDLEKAKKAVELALAMSDRQLDLFD